MKNSKKIWGALALSTMLAGSAVGVLAQPPEDAPKGDNPPNNADRGPRGKGNKGDGPGRPGGRDGRNGLMMMDADQLQKMLGDNLTDAQKAQLAGAAEERDQAVKAAQERFKAQVMQATGMSEQELGKKMREAMQKMRDGRGDRPNNGERPNRPDNGERPNRPDRPNKEGKPGRPDKPAQDPPPAAMDNDEA